MSVDEQLPLDLDALALEPVTTAALTDPTLSWEWRCWVSGVPAPQGSKNPMPIYKGKGPDRHLVKIVMVESSSERLKLWRRQVVGAAEAAWPHDPLDLPLVVGCRFLLPRFVKSRAGDWPVGSMTGDLSHLVRGVEDALTTAGVWVDDRRVVGYLGYPDTSKRFARPDEESGCEIVVRPAHAVPNQWAGFRPPVRHRT